MINIIIWTIGAFVWWFNFSLSHGELDFVLAVIYTVAAAWFIVERFGT